MPEPGTAENAGTAGTSVTAAPERLVEGGSIILGNWTGFPGNANLIDVHRPYHYPLPRAVKNLRLKEWQAIQAGDDRWFVFAVLYDAKFLSMASIVIYDRMLKKDFGFRHLFPGSRFPLSPRLMDSDCGIRNSHDYLHFSMDRTARRLNISASSYRKRRTPSASNSRSISPPPTAHPSRSACRTSENQKQAEKSQQKPERVYRKRYEKPECGHKQGVNQMPPPGLMG